MQFSEKLKQLRAKKGVSQAELADNIFVSRSAVAKWENGLGLPSDESLRLISDFFGVTVSELLSDPVTESVIVNQNSVLSKQKIWIIALSAAVLLALIVVVTLSILFVNKPEQAAPPKPVITRELLFDTEKYLAATSLVSYPDSEISADKIFPDSRVFEFYSADSDIQLPELVVRVTADEQVSYEYINYADVAVSCSDNLIPFVQVQWNGFAMAGIFIGLKDYHIKELVGWVNIKYNDLLLSVKVFLNHIKVESVTIGFAGDNATIELTKSKMLTHFISPWSASYQDIHYTIEQITRPNGEIYDGDLSVYATIENNYLTATKQIEIGSTIYISATADYDKVRSNTFAVTVERIAIEHLFLGDSNYFRAGESKLINLVVWPQDASFNVLGEQATVMLMTPGLVTLEQTEDGYLVTASSDYNAVDNEVYINVETPEGVSDTFSFHLLGINVESVTLLNAETGEEADEVIYMRRNSTMQFSAVVAPINATYDKVHYGVVANVNNFSRYVTMSEDGLLTVTSIAPYDIEIYVSVSAGRAHSKAYRIVVEKVAVESVTISCDTVDEIHIDEIAHLSTVYFPTDADNTSVRYYFVDKVDGVYLSGNRLWVSSGVAVGTQFQVYSIVDGIQSNVLTFTVVASTE